MQIPNTQEQRRGDFFMLDIQPIPGTGKYKVGPWILWGPAMEVARRNRTIREALLFVNPRVPPGIKRTVLGSMAIAKE